MNLCVTQSAKTTAIDTKNKTTLIDSPKGAFPITKGDTDPASEGSKTSKLDEQDSSNAGLYSNEKNGNSSNTVELSKPFTTQNFFEILPSIQNKTVPDNIVSSATFATLNLPTYSTALPLTLYTTNTESLNNCADSVNVVLPQELTKETNPAVPQNSSSSFETTLKTTFSTLSNSITNTVNVFKYDNVISRADEIQKKSTVNSDFIDDDFEFDIKERDLPCTESGISVNSVKILPGDQDSISKSSENSGELIRSIYSLDCTDKTKNITRLSERAKKKSWYNVLYPNYKSRSQTFKKLFKEVPNDERLIVDYSCALYKDLLIQGRLYISQNYVSFHANILGWETCFSIKWNDVTSITKEKTALVIPNAILICTLKEKFFFSSFATRDKTFLLLFRVWQNTLMNKPMTLQEIWQLVHNFYGEELGLTSDDEDYIDPTSEDQDMNISNFELLVAIDDSKTLSINEDNLEISSTNNYQIVSSTSVNSASNISGNNSCNSSYNKKIRAMKTNAKALALVLATSEDGGILNSQIQSTTSIDSTAGGNLNNANNSVSVVKDVKQSSNYDPKRKVPKSNRQREENTNKNSENLPTDISDSSDSEENSIPFIATAECNSLHEGRQLVHTILPINIETLFNLLFSKSKFLLDFHTLRKSTDLVFGEWHINENGQKTRTFNVTVQLAASVGPKTSKVTEFQVMRDCSKPGELYSIDINNVNAGIPYADSFSVLVHYCLVKTVDDHTMLSVHAQIKYKKSIWGVVKGFIEKNTWAGLDDFYTSLLHSLQSETCIPPAKGKGRRPRRGTATQIRPPEELPILQTKPEAKEHCSVTKTVSTRNSINSLAVTYETRTKFKCLSLSVLVLLFFLIIVNVILLLKLWKLEERIEGDMTNRAHLPNMSFLRQLPNNHQDWINLLRQQEILYETELKKWHNVLQTAIVLLKKTETTLAELLFRS